jgi:hypothetical protein
MAEGLADHLLALPFGVGDGIVVTARIRGLAGGTVRRAPSRP